MRDPIISFSIENQHIRRTDSFYIVNRSVNYLKAQFSFLTDDWADVEQKWAIFEGNDQTKLVMITDNLVTVPWEVLADGNELTVSVYGGDLITTDTVKCYVAKSGYKDAEESEIPTPDAVEQLLSYVDECMDEKVGYAEVNGSVLSLYTDDTKDVLISSVNLPSGGGGTGTTYTFSISGHTITITPSQGQAQTITIPVDWTENQIRALITGYGYSTFDGDYNSLSNKPVIPSAVTDDHINDLIDTKVAGIHTHSNKTVLDSIKQSDIDGWNAKAEKGDKGDPGTNATVSVGTVTTLPAGSAATVQNVGTESAAVFNFGIPKGDKGDDGSSPEITVPTKTSDLENDSGFVTDDQIPTDSHINDLIDSKLTPLESLANEILEVM